MHGPENQLSVRGNQIELVCHVESVPTSLQRAFAYGMTQLAATRRSVAGMANGRRESGVCHRVCHNAFLSTPVKHKSPAGSPDGASLYRNGPGYTRTTDLTL